jgi:hypothetical protein
MALLQRIELPNGIFTEYHRITSLSIDPISMTAEATIGGYKDYDQRTMEPTSGKIRSQVVTAGPQLLNQVYPEYETAFPPSIGSQYITQNERPFVDAGARTNPINILSNMTWECDIELPSGFTASFWAVTGLSVSWFTEIAVLQYAGYETEAKFQSDPSKFALSKDRAVFQRDAFDDRFDASTLGGDNDNLEMSGFNREIAYDYIKQTVPEFQGATDA